MTLSIILHFEPSHPLLHLKVHAQSQYNHNMPQGAKESIQRNLKKEQKLIPKRPQNIPTEKISNINSKIPIIL